MELSPDQVRSLIEAGIQESVALVTTPRVHEEQGEDAHFAAIVVSPSFEGLSLVDQHKLVYDAVGDHMTRTVHALEISTFTPEAYAEHGDGALADTLRERGLWADEA